VDAASIIDTTGMIRTGDKLVNLGKIAGQRHDIDWGMFASGRPVA
jgi:hypothetical protein